MKFEIKKYDAYGNKYHIELNEVISDIIDMDTGIARYLGLTYDNYINILKSYNAYLPVNYIEYYFNTVEDAEKAIIKLESHLVMKKLVE